MKKSDAECMAEALRGDLASFIARVFETTDPSAEFLPNWHIDLIASRLEEVAAGKIKRLIINMPPRSLKSVCVSVAWPAWLLGLNPATRIMAASYSSALSLKHSLDTRLVLGADWYGEVFPDTIIASDQNEKAKFVTTKRGFRFATSVGGTATGEGADFLIVDDPHNPMQAASFLQRERGIDWFDQTFSTRLNNKKKGAIVLVMQRLHVEDLSGHLLKKGGWEHLCLPAIAEKKMDYSCGKYNEKIEVEEGSLLHAQREGEDEIARAKIELGSYGFSAQYQQNPVLVKGGMVDVAWIQRYGDERLEVRGKELEITYPLPLIPNPYLIQSWDTAIKSGKGNDYSVCTTWAVAGEGYYLIDVVSAQVEYPALKHMCINLAEKYKPSAILIEDKASGQSLLQDLRATKFPVIAVNPDADKITRFSRVTPLFEAGKIFLPHRAAWLADYEMQLLGFPNAAHDDMVDSTSQFLNWVRGKNAGPRVRGL